MLVDFQIWESTYRQSTKCLQVVTEQPGWFCGWPCAVLSRCPSRGKKKRTSLLPQLLEVLWSFCGRSQPKRDAWRAIRPPLLPNPASFPSMTAPLTKFLQANGCHREWQLVPEAGWSKKMDSRIGFGSVFTCYLTGKEDTVTDARWHTNCPWYNVAVRLLKLLLAVSSDGTSMKEMYSLLRCIRC